MAEILTIGEILVEVMAKEVGQKFEKTGEFVGPFPSGAPAIFIDQAAKLGSSCGIVSKVGNDGFGKINVDRLKRDGVDVQHIGVVRDKTTGIAFVTYEENGNRDFIFNIKDSASACITREDVREDLFEGCKFLHVVGCSAFSEEMIAVLQKAILYAKKRDVRISFDPNIRKEIMENEQIRQFILFVLKNCDIFLPGQEELKWITGIEDEETAARFVMNQKATCVIVKRGSKGCRVYEPHGFFDVAPYVTKEVDPTGAGDCFAGAFVSLMNQGRSVEEAVNYANAAGARSVTKKGPMEGTATLEEIDAFIQAQQI
jgi:sugar/nucleoside kinase (ribokinase family)